MTLPKYYKGYNDIDQENIIPDDWKNYGLDLIKEQADRQEEDWLGSGEILKDEILVQGNRKKYTPVGEMQKGKEDTMACTANGPANVLEVKSNYGVEENIFSQHIIDWFEKNDFFSEKGLVEIADANLAIRSGTTRNGNSMKAPIHQLHKTGIAPKKLLPLTRDMRWWDYHNPKRLTKEVERIEKESLELFDFNYEKVLIQNFDKVINKDMLVVAGYAWPLPKNGEYPRVNYRPNHVFVYLEKPAYEIWDSYPDSWDGDYIKNLATDYGLLYYGYRIIMREKNNPKSFISNDNLMKFIKAGVNPPVYLKNFDDDLFPIADMNTLRFLGGQKVEEKIQTVEQEEIKEKKIKETLQLKEGKYIISI